MTRQTLLFKKEYQKYEFIQEINKLWNIYADTEIELNSQNIELTEASKHIINSMEIGLKAKYNYNFCLNTTPIKSTYNPNFMLCCVSGGKDSVATAIYYKNLGYDVHLYTVKGINLGYPEEYNAAIRIAKALQLPIYIDEIKITGKKFYIEHPLKNQVIASMALAYCLENDLPTNISFGNYQKEGNNLSNWGVSWTDNYDLWKEFNIYIKYFIDNAHVFIPFYEEDDALTILNDNFNIVPLYQSCLSSIRHRNYLKTHNEEKYNISLFPNRCGSCYKCCIEYIYFCDHDKLEYNKDFYKHCLEILKKKYEEYTGQKRTFKNWQEVYLAYFKDISKSKYFNE